MGFDVTAVGELLTDMIQCGTSPRGNPILEANPGGAPCNVLAMLAKLGRRCAFIGKVGRDGLGRHLTETVSGLGIDVSGLVTDAKTPTTLALVHNGQDGERSFSFYRNPGADTKLRERELPMKTLAGTRILHFGTLSMTHRSAERATRRAVREASEHGALLSFDPNLRPALWSSPDAAKEKMEFGFSVCQILKIADDELEFFTGEADYTRGAECLLERFSGIELLNVTLGSRGSCAFTRNARVYVPALEIGPAVDTTGAGDAFCGCVLDFILERGCDGLDEEKLCLMLTFANAAAAVVTTRKGALLSMPERGEIEKVLSERGLLK